MIEVATYVATVSSSFVCAYRVFIALTQSYIADNELLMSKQKGVSMETSETAWICHCTEEAAIAPLLSTMHPQSVTIVECYALRASRRGKCGYVCFLGQNGLSDTFVLHLKSLNKNVPLLHTQWGQTAVYWASHNGHSEVVKLLVQAGADLELQHKVY